MWDTAKVLLTADAKEEDWVAFKATCKPFIIMGLIREFVENRESGCPLPEDTESEAGRGQ